MKETAPDAELVARETGLTRGMELVEKFRMEYAGVEVDPEADLAEVRTGRLDQLPSATHTRLLSAATEMKGFAEGMIAKLSAADYSLLVRVSVFLWGRASAPTGCSPRDSGRLLAISPDLPCCVILTWSSAERVPTEAERLQPAACRLRGPPEAGREADSRQGSPADPHLRA